MPSLYFPALVLGAMGVWGKTESKQSEDPILICDASTFKPPYVGPGVEVLSLSAVPQHNYSTTGIQHTSSVNGLNFCQVKVHLHHSGTDDKVLVEIWLPETKDDWNGRFQATGGGAYATGVFEPWLVPAVKDGYASSATDGGHSREKFGDLSWALKPDGEVNWHLLQLFATTSLAEQIIVGKDITGQFYGEEAHHSYFNGCSQGGRQGYMLAQKYPSLVDGILASAPAISLTYIAMGEFWPQLVMKEEGIWMTKCELDYFRQKAMEACDMLDGVRDGVISDPDVCDFDPLHVIGQTFYCDDQKVEVTEAMAAIILKINQGPQTPFKAPIWHGLSVGTGMHWLAKASILPDGARVPEPFGIPSQFFQALLLRDLAFNVTKLTYGDFMALWAQASYNFGWLWDADSPDLNSFRQSGAKLLSWHGMTDPLIPYQNTVRYRERVEMIMGGADKVDSFYRLFLAPGVEHCLGGAGPAPKDPLGALVRWVESNDPPETLDASTTTSKGELVTRELCAWPAKPQYMGIGDPNRASTWSCVGGTERIEYVYNAERESQNRFIEYAMKRKQEKEKKGLNRAGEILGGLKDRLEGLGMGLRAE